MAENEEEEKDTTQSSSPEDEQTTEDTSEPAEKPDETPEEESEEADEESVEDEEEESSQKMVPLSELQKERGRRRNAESALKESPEEQPQTGDLPGSSDEKEEKQKAMDFVGPDGTFDVEAYDGWKTKQNQADIQQALQTKASIEADTRQAEDKYPSLKKDDELKKMVGSYAFQNKVTLSKAADVVMGKVTGITEKAEETGKTKKASELTEKERAHTAGTGRKVGGDEDAELKERMSNQDPGISDPARQEWLKKLNKKQRIV